VKYLSNNPRPAVDEINPAVLNAQVLCLLLGAGLVQEYQISPVIKIPDDAVLREGGGIGNRRPGCVLA